MPESKYNWLKRDLILSFEELTRSVALFQQLGVDRLRITGGEPLLRQELPVLIEQLAALGLNEIALTTNGVLLKKYYKALFSAGLDRVTVSLDAVDSEIFRGISQRDNLSEVLKGLRAVAHSPGLKIDSVMMKGVNDCQLFPLLKLGGEVGAEVRFIEYMDVGGATEWESEKVLSQDEMLERLKEQFGEVVPLDGRGSAPAQRFQLPHGQTFGVIASTTRPFCAGCDRVRVTADGQLLTCLYSRVGKDLRKLLRSELTDQEIVEQLRNHWSLRTDRGAEQRLQLEKRGPLAKAQELQENVHLEMHTRGG